MLRLGILLLVLLWKGNCKDQLCPAGQFTKTTPSEETDLATCKQFSCNSCCGPEITEQLVKVPLQIVGGMNYTQCGGLSDYCSQYISYMQCFYQCSPNLTPWLNSTTRRLNNLPVCSEFCDLWYGACMNDKTCVTGGNWLDGFDRVKDPDSDIFIFQCKSGATCRNFSEVYSDGRSMCNDMWKGILQYTEGSNCVNPAHMEHNVEYIENGVGGDYATTICESVHYTDVGLIIGVVVGILAGIALIVGLVYVILTNKNKTAKKQPATAKEMEELNPPKPTA